MITSWKASVLALLVSGICYCATLCGQTVSEAPRHAKPSWQTGTGVPADDKRDVPDVSLFASSGAVNSAYICV